MAETEIKDNITLKKMSSTTGIYFISESSEENSSIYSLESFNFTQEILSNNISGNNEDSDFWSDSSLFALLPRFLYMTICLVTLCSNVALFVVFCRRFSKMTPTKVCLMNLAFADVILILLCIPNNILDQSWIKNIMLCKLYKLFSDVCFSVFAITMAFMCVQEFLSSRYSTYKSDLLLDVKCSACINVSIWIITIAISVPTSNHSRLTKTVCEIFSMERLEKVLTIIDFVYFFAIPVPIILAFYFILLYKKKNSETFYLRIRKNHSITECKSTKIVRIMAVLFFIFYLPNYIYMVILFLGFLFSDLYVPPENIEFLVPIIYWFKYIHTALNPILILLASRRYRQYKTARSSFASSDHSRRISRLSITSFNVLDEQHASNTGPTET